MTPLRSPDSFFESKINPDRRASATKEKGGSPEDSRQKVNPMEAVAEAVAPAKTPRIIPSLESPEAKAGAWLDKQVAIARESGVITQMTDVGPALARALLNRNPDNRKLSEVLASAYARDMKNGAWKFNGEPIIVSKDGKLNDGQHRCEGIIRADVDVTTLLVIGVERETRNTLDQGKTRTIGDFLSMDGVPSGSIIGTIGSFVWQVKNYGTVNTSSKNRPTKSEVLDFVHDHPGLIRSLRAVDRKGVLSVGGKSVLGTVHWLVTEKAGQRPADEFVNAMIEGAGLKVGSPILYVRNRLINEGRRYRAHEKMELILKAWNAYREGKTVRNFELSGGELPKISE